MPVRRVLALTAPLALVVALGLAGCSAEVSVGSKSVSQSDLEDQIAGQITGEDAADVDVACEGDLDAKVDATQDCSATYQGDTTGIRVTVDEVDGSDVSFSTQLFITADDMATAVQGLLEQQGVTVDGVTCDGELIGEVDESVSCDVSSPDGDGTVSATTTSVDGLTVNFHVEQTS